MEITKETRLIDLSVGQLLEILSKNDKPTDRKFVYGVDGVCDLFGCSKPTAIRMMKKDIKKAVSKHGRKIVVDAELALKLGGMSNE